MPKTDTNRELARQALTALDRLVERGNHRLEPARTAALHFYEDLVSLECLADALEREYQKERMSQAESEDFDSWLEKEAN